MTEWRHATVGDLITLQRGIDLPDAERCSGSVPIMGSFGITGRHDSAPCHGPGVTVGRSGASIGSVSYIEEDYWPLNTCLYVRDFKGNSRRFVYYFLKTLDLPRLNSGSAQPSLNRNFVHPISIRFPGLAEQDAIASVLSALDDKIDLNRRMNETLEAMARAIFKDWFVNFGPVRAKMEGRDPGIAPEIATLFSDRLGENGLPEGWQLERLLSRARLLSGGTPKTDVPAYWKGEIAWASAKDVSQCRDAFLVETERTITDRGLQESATQIIPRLATVIVARGATTGRHCMLSRDMAMNQTCYALVSLRSEPFFLFCAFKSLAEELVNAAHGSVFDTITTETFSRATIVSPINGLAAEFEKQVEPIFGQVVNNLKEASTLASLRNLLLPKLMSGELRVKDVEKLAEQAA